MDEFIAHRREYDLKIQSVETHLTEVSELCGRFAGKVGLSKAGKIIGLLHDLGKYSNAFQTYIQSATGILDPDIDEDCVDARFLKGKIDHSTAGAQQVWSALKNYGIPGKIAGQILSVCLASHHGGLMDCLTPDGTDWFLTRINKKDEKTHLHECIKAVDKKILNQIEQLMSDNFLKEFSHQLVNIYGTKSCENRPIKAFRMGFLTRFLFSCLIDADRISSADFEIPENVQYRSVSSMDWQVAIFRLEKKLANFGSHNPIDKIRCEISEKCLEQANNSQGIYTFTVPTGGGKTLSSIRFALHHAQKHSLDHIIYIIPYTSIIEQNAGVLKKVLEKEGDKFSWVTEHHSNLDPATQTWHSKLVAENWDAPIIFTTMVQFLEALFSGGTRGARHMHNIANSVLIFDEIQNLPVNCVHLFCNAISFFTQYTRTTTVLCTATQPLLNNLRFPEKGQLDIPESHELAGNVAGLFDQLKRVEIKNLLRPGGWSETELGKLIIGQYQEKGNCLVIVNTKKWAQKLYTLCMDTIDDDSLFHLSTSLCPAHRKKILDTVCQRLENKQPVLCISTQLIEAGVDVDFNSVVRFLAGLDSIAQAAGRCNRNGNLPKAQVYVVNPEQETIDMLVDIKVGRDKAERVFSEKKEETLLNPETMDLYFKYYFHDRAKIMDYPLTAKQAGRDDTLLNLLGDNHLNSGHQDQPFKLQQSFKTAGKAFKTIDAPTQAVIVPYGKGKKIIGELCAAFEPARAYELLKQAQKYSVNVFPNVWQQLKKIQAVRPIQAGEEIYYLDAQYYSEDFGLSIELVNPLEMTMF